MCAPGGLRSELILCHRPSWWLLPFKKSCGDTNTKVPSKCSHHLYHIWVPSTPPTPLLSWSPLAPTWTHLRYWNSLHTSLSSILIYPLQFTLYKKIWMTLSPPMTSQLHWSCYNNSNDLTPTSPSDFILYYPPWVHTVLQSHWPVPQYTKFPDHSPCIFSIFCLEHIACSALPGWLLLIKQVSIQKLPLRKNCTFLANIPLSPYQTIFFRALNIIQN